MSGQAFCVRGLEDWVLLRCQASPNSSADATRFRQYHRWLFCKNWRAHGKLIWEGKGSSIAKTILKTNRLGGLRLPHLKIHRSAAAVGSLRDSPTDGHVQGELITGGEFAAGNNPSLPLSINRQQRNQENSRGKK